MCKENILYSPWRLQYILSAKQNSCIFCFDNNDKDLDHFVVYRTKHSFVILNLFPYNNGHIMVVPNRHISSLSELSEDELHDLFDTVRLGEIVIKNVYKPEGINVGINLGKAAGAGVDAHLHVHILPRWLGDSGFITSISGTRVIPEEFSRTYKIIKEGFDNVTANK